MGDSGFIYDLIQVIEPNNVPHNAFLVVEEPFNQLSKLTKNPKKNLRILRSFYKKNFPYQLLATLECCNHPNYAQYS